MFSPALATSACNDIGGGCLVTDCSGSFCETDADCPEDRICDPSSNYIPPDVPAGCVLDPAGTAGAAGAAGAAGSN